MGKRPLLRLFRSRSGTAEIVGSVLFLVILLFFFTNVYLWHDQVTRRMDNVVVDKLNSAVEVGFDGASTLTVTNKGGVGVALSRLWIIEPDNHNYADFSGSTIWVAGGASVNIQLLGSAPLNSDGSYRVGLGGVYYPAAPYGQAVVFKIITSLGNMAAYQIVP